MKTRNKTLLITICAVLLVAVSIFGTLAYLTDSEGVTNTFSVGSVGLKLDETDVNTDGTKASDTRVQKNDYELLPGRTYIKDPTVTVDAGSEEAYVRMIVTVSFKDALTDATLATQLDDIFTGYDAGKWPRYEKTVSADNKTITYEYRYYTTVDGKNAAGEDEALQLEALFTSMTVPGAYDNNQLATLNGMTIDIEAHAIQAAGFDTADAAWDAFAKQHP